MFCNKCGARNSDTALVCRICGSRLGEKSGSSAGGADARQAMPGGSSNGSFVVLASLVAVIFVVVMVSPFVPAIRGPINSAEAKLVAMMDTLYPQNTNSTTTANALTAVKASMQQTTTVPGGGTTKSTSTAPGESYITAINVQVSYIDNATNTSMSITKTYGGINLTAGSQFPYTMSFSDNGSNAFIIDSITPLTPGFSVNSMTPHLPYTVTPGSNISITSIVRIPNSTYTGTLTIGVNETAGG